MCPSPSPLSTLEVTVVDLFCVTSHLLLLPKAFAVCSSALSNRALFRDHHPREPFKMVLLMNCAVGCETGSELVPCF